jgi:hypothetical protein
MARREVHEKFNIGIHEETTVVVELTMSNGLIYNILIKNKEI